MSRTSPLYYIAPSAISITPNANGSSRDLAVYVARGAKVKLYDPRIAALGMGTDSTFQEWTLSGRNRRLAESYADNPFTIYARLRKVTDFSDASNVSSARADGYLVFAARQKNEDTDEWEDPYILTINTSRYGGTRGTGADGQQYTWGPIPARQAEAGRSNYWWVKLGTVSAPDENGQRTVDLDTGILGTDQYNSQWHLNPDDLPDKEVRYILEDRGQWTATPKVVYTGPTGQRTPDGTLDNAVAAILGWMGEEPLSFTQGQEIDESYHFRSLTRLRWLTQRLSTDNDDLTDADLYTKLTEPTKGWEVENTLEISRAWRGDKLWQCKRTGTTEEPGLGCTDWQLISGNTVFRADFEEPYQLYDPDNFQAALTVYCLWGSEEVTSHLLEQDIEWTRYTEDSHGNPRTASDTAWNTAHAYSAWRSGRRTLTLTQADLDAATDFPSLIRFRCDVTLRDGEGAELYTDYVELEHQS